MLSSALRGSLAATWLAVVATPALAQPIEQSPPPNAPASLATEESSLVTVVVLGSRHDRAYRRCSVRLRVLARDVEGSPRVGDELEAVVSCYAFMLHQLRRPGRAFRMRLTVRAGSSVYLAQTVGGVLLGPLRASQPTRR